MTRPKPLVLIILDGWGYRAETKANAIALARKPTYTLSPFTQSTLRHPRTAGQQPKSRAHSEGISTGLPQSGPEGRDNREARPR